MIYHFFVFSLNDQYVNYSNEEYNKLIKRIEKTNSNIKIYILNDNHFIDNSKEEFFQIVQISLRQNNIIIFVFVNYTFFDIE